MAKKKGSKMKKEKSVMVKKIKKFAKAAADPNKKQRQL